MRRITLASLLVVGAVVCARPVHAHPPPFYWMPDLSVDSRVGVDVLLGTSERIYDSAIIVDASVFAEIAVTNNISVLGRIPFSYASYTIAGAPTVEESAFALGNISLGVQFAETSRLRRQSRLRYGMALLGYVPTASDSGESGRAAAVTGDFNVPDTGRYLPETTSLRIRGDLRYETDTVFLQGDLAFDYHIDHSSDDHSDLLLGLGVGIAFNPYLAVLAELTLLSDIIDDGDPLRPVLDLGMRYHNPDMMAGLRVYWPFDEIYRDAGAIGLGIDIAFRF